MKHKVLIITKSISRNTGGGSSILDLAEKLRNIGYDINLGLLVSSKLAYIIRDYKKHKTIIPLTKIYALPKDLKNILLDKKALLARASSLIDKSCKFFGLWMTDIEGFLFKSKFYNTLKRSEVVIFAVPLSRGAKEFIKSKTNARLVYNHAGSVDTYENFWLTNRNRPKNYNDNYSLYINYCKQFDNILFQAYDQAEECSKKASILKDLPVVIKPTCEENKVLSAKKTDSPYIDNTFNIVNIGSIMPRKAQEMSIQAFELVASKYSNVFLHFVGSLYSDPDYYLNIKKLAKTRNLENRIHFHGHRDDYLRYLAHADILLQTSRAEGVSRIIRESMLLKIPIVSFEISGIKSTLEADKEAFLIKPFEVHKIAYAIEHIVSDPTITIDVVESAFQKYLSNHSSVVYACNLDSFITSIVNK